MESDDSEFPALQASKKSADDKYNDITAYHCCESNMCNDLTHVAAAEPEDEATLAAVFQHTIAPELNSTDQPLGENSAESVDATEKAPALPIPSALTAAVSHQNKESIDFFAGELHTTTYVPETAPLEQHPEVIAARANLTLYESTNDTATGQSNIRGNIPFDVYVEDESQRKIAMEALSVFNVINNNIKTVAPIVTNSKNDVIPANKTTTEGTIPESSTHAFDTFTNMPTIGDAASGDKTISDHATHIIDESNDVMQSNDVKTVPTEIIAIIAFVPENHTVITETHPPFLDTPATEITTTTPIINNNFTSHVEVSTLDFNNVTVRIIAVATVIDNSTSNVKSFNNTSINITTTVSESSENHNCTYPEMTTNNQTTVDHVINTFNSTENVMNSTVDVTVTGQVNYTTNEIENSTTLPINLTSNKNEPTMSQNVATTIENVTNLITDVKSEAQMMSNYTTSSTNISDNSTILPIIVTSDKSTMSLNVDNTTDTTETVIAEQLITVTQTIFAEKPTTIENLEVNPLIQPSTIAPEVATTTRDQEDKELYKEKDSHFIRKRSERSMGKFKYIQDNFYHHQITDIEHTLRERY